VVNLDYRAKLALAIAGQAGVLLLIGLAVYRPSVTGVQDVKEQMAQLSAQQAENCQLLRENPAPEAEIAQAKAEIQQLESRIPPERRISWVSARLADTLRAHNIDLQAATRWCEEGTPPPQPELKRLEKTITVRCSARDLQEFLVSLNRLPFAVAVEDLAAQRAPQWGVVTAHMKLATFVLRARAVPAAPAATQPS